MILTLIFITNLLFSQNAACIRDDKLFPCDKYLETKVNFWIKIYTEISVNRGMFHNVDTYEEYALADISDENSRKHQQFIKHKKNELSANLGIPVDMIRFQKGQMENYHSGLERSYKYLSYIKNILTEHNVPEDLAYLPHVESSFNYQAYSKMGAAGIWQFMRGTGKRYMQIDYTIDERRDPVKATIAAAKLLKDNYSKLEKWPLAITAYNHGPSGMKRAVNKTGSIDLTHIIKNYKSRNFGFASKNFYTEFLAARHIAKNYKLYFPDIKPYEELHYASAVLPYYSDLSSLLVKLDISKEDFANYNPSLRNTVMDGKRYLPKGFEVRIPPALLATLQGVINEMPKEKRFAEQIQPKWHKVNYGETLSSISKMYRVSVGTLIAINGLGHRGRIRAGQILELPFEKEKTKRGLVKTTLASLNTNIKKVEAIVEKTTKKTIVAENTVKEESTVVAEKEIEPLYGPPPPFEPTAFPGVLEEKFVVYNYNDKFGQTPNGYVIVQPEETLSHFADWLMTPKATIKRWSNTRRNYLYINQKLKVYFSKVSKEDFETKRIEYHKEIYEDFFANYTIKDFEIHVLARNETLWNLSQQYNVPLWLLYVNNQAVDFSVLSRGDKIKIPIIESKTVDTTDQLIEQ